MIVVHRRDIGSTRSVGWPFWLLVVFILSACASTNSPPPGTLAPDWVCEWNALASETEIVFLPGVHSTNRFVAIVKPLNGKEWLRTNEPALEIWSHDKRMHRTRRVDMDGSVEPVALPPGQYCFRASALGFATVIGRVRIDRRVSSTPLDVWLALGL
jgi:hypothetical protein